MKTRQNAGERKTVLGGCTRVDAAVMSGSFVQSWDKLVPNKSRREGWRKAPQILPSGPVDAISCLICSIFSRSRGAGAGGGVLGVLMASTRDTWRQEVVAGLNLEGKEAEMCRLDSRLTSENT